MAEDTDSRDSVIAGLDKLLGVRRVRADADGVVLEYDIDERHKQPYGIVHGGMHCTVVESACSIGAGIFAMAYGKGVVGVENHTSFIRAARSGTVTVTAVPITRGRRTQLWEATSRDSDGKVLSTGRVRLLCIDRESQIAGEKFDAKK